LAGRVPSRDCAIAAFLASDRNGFVTGDTIEASVAQTDSCNASHLWLPFLASESIFDLERCSNALTALDLALDDLTYLICVAECSVDCICQRSSVAPWLASKLRTSSLTAADTASAILCLGSSLRIDSMNAQRGPPRRREASRAMQYPQGMRRQLFVDAHPFFSR